MATNGLKRRRGVATIFLATIALGGFGPNAASAATAISAKDVSAQLRAIRADVLRSALPTPTKTRAVRKIDGARSQLGPSALQLGNPLSLFDPCPLLHRLDTFFHSIDGQDPAVEQILDAIHSLQNAFNCTIVC